WALLFTLMTLPNLIEYEWSFKQAPELNLAVSILLIIIGAFFTKHLPDWLSYKMIEKKFKIDFKKHYKGHKKNEKTLDLSKEAAFEKPDKTNAVIIVGAGPIGLASAILLQQHGVDV